MNQIIFDKKTNQKKLYIFRVQFILSIILINIFLFIYISKYINEEKLEDISNVTYQNLELSKIYNKTQSKNKTFLGKILIEKINLEYSIFNDCNDELLKISPCKFYGSNFGEKGNVCIAAHNYNDERFFGRINELEIKDVIKVIDLENTIYEYVVYDKFETEENDLSILENNKKYELTLLTCNNSNQKRIIVKAYMKEY